MASRNKAKEDALSLEALRSALHYDQETGIFTRRHNSGRALAGDIAGHIQNNGYRVIRVNFSKYLAGRLAWFYVHGEWPNEIDHINRIKDDNRIHNLRAVTRRENRWNSRSLRETTLNAHGVVAKRNKFEARLHRNGTYVFRKTFASIEEAVAARSTAEQQYLAQLKTASMEVAYG